MAKGSSPEAGLSGDGGIVKLEISGEELSSCCESGFATPPGTHPIIAKDKVVAIILLPIFVRASQKVSLVFAGVSLGEEDVGRRLSS